jgi:hypothetical protein
MATFYCFSPPVMIATFVTEIILAIYVLVRYLDSTVKRLAVAMLFFLALFQLAEYNVCGGYGISAAEWSRVGFVAINMLPPLGLHLARAITGRKANWLTHLAYGTAAFWAAVFAFSERAFSGHVCAGNYVIFQVKQQLAYFYYGYYYGWLLAGITLCLRFARQAKKPIREALYLQVTGYMVFLLPTTVVNTVKPETVSGIPSIMCGFAVIFAFVLVVGIVPATVQARPFKKTIKT